MHAIRRSLSSLMHSNITLASPLRLILGLIAVILAVVLANLLENVD